MSIRINTNRHVKGRALDILEDEVEDRVLRVDLVDPRRDKDGVAMTHVEFVVEDDQFPQDNGVRIYREYSHKNDQSMGWLRELIESAFDAPLEGDDEGDLDVEESDLVGKLVVGSCYNEQWQGRTWPRLGETAPLSALSEEPTSEESVEDTEEASEPAPRARR